MKDAPVIIRNNKLWKDVYSLVVDIYDKIEDIIANFPDEQWATASKLRNTANDSLFYASQAIGSATPEVNLYDWNNTRKNLFTLQSMYTFAAKQEFIDLEPELIVKIDNLLEEIDKKISESRKEADKCKKEELDP